jgi:NAD+ synthase (glutamine-hydrolysing)
VNPGQDFFNLHNHDFVRIAVGVPSVQVADPAYNAARTIDLMEAAVAERAVAVLFPELGLSAYTCDDLFHQRALLEQVSIALRTVLEASERLPILTVVGLPLQAQHLLFNCAAVIYRGRVLGVVPKTYLPTYREFYEARYFTSGDVAQRTSIEVVGQVVPFGSQLLFQAAEPARLTLHVEICEDVWVPIPPSSYAALAGATVLLNLSASNVTVAKADYRRQLVSGQSARCLSAYVYSGAGPGESTTDLAWDGHALIAEVGNIVAESQRFQDRAQLITADVDLERISQERMRQNTFGLNAQREKSATEGFRTIRFDLDLPRTGELLVSPQRYQRFPYVPADPARRDERCSEVYEIQVQGLTKRLRFTGIEKPVIAVSGGLDSTHALLVCARAMDRLGYPRSNVLAYTMPGFATSDRTLAQARQLMDALGCTGHELDIRPACMQMLKDIGHPFASGQPVYDTTFENVQAGERTSHVFRLSNLHHGLVVGTGDLSELALGWCTYGVGDHMSHYAVNASVPKTLIQYIVRWVAQTQGLGPHVSETLMSVLDTEISPELVPADEGNAAIQSSEAFIGPFELQDFNLYYTLRFGFSPARVAFLAYCAWHAREAGVWPDIPPEQRRQYTIGEIKRHLGTFLYRFFQLSQFKRTAIPNAPKVGSGGSVSPRGDWRAPSDAEAAAWLAELDLIPDTA